MSGELLPMRDMGLGALMRRVAERVANSIENLFDLQNRDGQVMGNFGEMLNTLTTKNQRNEGAQSKSSPASWTLGSSPLSGDVRAPETRQAALQPLIQDAARRYGVPVDLVNAVIRVESNFRPDAVSHAGALGLMQLMPATARGLGIENPLDPAQNIEGGVRHLSKLLAGFKDVSLALAAYNAGSYAVNKHRGIPPYPETQTYVRRVMAIYGGSVDRQG